MAIFFLLLAIYLVVDFYAFSAVRLLIENSSQQARRLIQIGYWVVSGALLIGLFSLNWLDGRTWRMLVMVSFFIVFMGKLFSSVFLLIDDLRRGITWLVNLFPGSESEYSTSRSKFMSQTALAAGAIPIATMSYGILSGAHDYRVRTRQLSFPNLPAAFDGIRIAQISDIHTGSFFNKTAVSGGVDMLNGQKPDLVFFTGDLVNDESREAKDYLDIFNKVQAPLGVYSVMGNHDYGDYRQWSSQAAKQRDIQNLHDMHRYMGWDILLNENRTVKVDGEELAVLGVENWGKGRFSKYGDLDKTYRGTGDKPFKILMSHDPSHWDAQIRQDHPDIDLTLSGHTHGFQFGVEIGNWKWSPSQYIYKQWVDLYQEGNQYLYVNRGFGYIGYPGRIGILPEITILELKRS